jgi:hypothetical protein
MRQIIIPIVFIAAFIGAVSQVGIEASNGTTPTRTATTSTGLYCPAALEAGTTYNNDSVDLSGDGAIYVHCVECNTGVYHPHDDGTVRCTYCGKAQSLHAQ